MAQEELKSRASTWWKFIFIIALVGVGTAGGYKLYEEGSKAGCFQLTEDLIPVEINPYRVDHLQLISTGIKSSVSWKQPALLPSSYSLYPPAVPTPTNAIMKINFHHVEARLFNSSCAIRILFILNYL
jgi:hypothetical protein